MPVPRADRCTSRPWPNRHGVIDPTTNRPLDTRALLNSWWAWRCTPIRNSERWKDEKEIPPSSRICQRHEADETVIVNLCYLRALGNSRCKGKFLGKNRSCRLAFCAVPFDFAKRLGLGIAITDSSTLNAFIPATRAFPAQNSADVLKRRSRWRLSAGCDKQSPAARASAPCPGPGPIRSAVRGSVRRRSLRPASRPRKYPPTD